MKNAERRLLAVGACAAILVAAMTPVGRPSRATRPRVPGVDLSAYSAKGPSAKTDLLFIHHSCGGQWLAAAGAMRGDDAHCIYAQHPNGGELRARLEAASYVVHEASYGSAIGERTDLFDWLPKFRDRMAVLLQVDEGDRLLEAPRTNTVVVFKSCFPNSDFVAMGAPPGDPSGPELTVANAKATMTALLPYLRARPDVLFVYVTAPPLAADRPIAAWKAAARAMWRALGKGRLAADESGALAREFDDWMKSPDGWLRGYPQANVVVFDYFDVLTGDGETNVNVYASGPGDSHPSSAGNERASAAFVPFLNRALDRLERSASRSRAGADSSPALTRAE